MKRTLKVVLLIYLAAAFLFVLSEAGWLTLPPTVHRLLAEVGVALLAVGSIHILDHFSIIEEVAGKIVSQSREMFDKALQSSTATMTGEVTQSISLASSRIVDDVTKQTESAFEDASQILQRQVESIKVMEQCSLMAIYPSRSAAAQAIRSAIAASGEVWLMGISLNEFCRERQGPFLEAWEELVKGVKGGTKKARLLLIDPYCHGAVLRSYSETVNSAGVSDRLEADVKAAAKLLHQIRMELGPRSSDLDVRLYGLAPMTFLCRLDTSTFTQNYHFWKSRLSGCPIPVLQYRKRAQGPEGVCIHSELEQHFEFIWRHSSLRLDDLSLPVDFEASAAHFYPRSSRGMEWGAHASGMGTVFIDRSRPAVRMQEEIRRSNRIWIQGITLKAFFDESSIAKSLAKRIADPKDSDIRVMLLHPDCDQAKFRAYREFLLNTDRKLPFTEFTTNHYGTCKLRSDLLDTIGKIDRIARKHEGARVKIKLYGTAPHMFVLIGDESAFVEQYSYGKLASQVPDEEVILGSDMPLIEYRRRIDKVYSTLLKEIRGEENEITEQLRPQPYPLLVDHFEYAWNQAVALQAIVSDPSMQVDSNGNAISATA